MTKKILLIIILLLITTLSTLFAQGGFEASINIPVGVAIGTGNDAFKELNYKGSIGLDSGLEVQLGYMHKVYNRIGAGFFIDLAYNYDSFVFKHTINNTDSSMYIHNLGIGFLPKFMIYNISIGIGGGIKIPIYGKKDLEYGYSSSVMHYFKATLDYSIFVSEKLAIVLGVYIAHDYGYPLKSIGDTPRFGGSGGGFIFGFKFGPQLKD